MVKYALATVLALAGLSLPAAAQTQNPYFALSYNTSQGTASMRLAGDFGVVVDTQNLTNYMMRVLRYSGISISTSVTMTGTSSMTITGAMSASTVTAANLYSTGQAVISGSMTVVGKVALGGVDITTNTARMKFTSIQLGDDALVDLSTDFGSFGFLKFVVSGQTAGCEFVFRGAGGSGTVYIVSDPASICAATDSDGYNSVYYSGGTKLKNRTGGTVTYAIQFVGF